MVFVVPICPPAHGDSRQKEVEASFVMQEFSCVFSIKLNFLCMISVKFMFEG
jgi:hypothetical protein